MHGLSILERSSLAVKLLILGWFIISANDLVLAQEVGSRVVVTAEQCSAYKDGEPFCTYPRGEHLYIERVAPNYYFIRDQGEELMIGHRDVSTIEDALAFFNERIETEKTATDLVHRSRIIYYLNNFDAAMKDLDEAEEMDNKIVQIYINRSAIFCQQNEYDYALEEIELASELDPDHPTVLNIQGIIAYHDDEYEEAMEFYQKCLDVNPSYSVAHSNRALVYYQQDESEKAIEEYKKCIEAAPARSTGYANYGRHLKDNEGKYDKAMEQLNKAIELNPKDRNALYHRADIHWERDEFAEYVRDMGVAVDVSPDKIEWKDNLAWMLATIDIKELRDGKRALDYALVVVEASEWEDADHIATLAAAYGATEQYEKAIEILDKASEVDRYNNYATEIDSMREAFEAKRQFFFER